MQVNCSWYDFCECGHARKVHRQGLKCEVCQYAAYSSVALADHACREFKLAKEAE